MTREFYVNDAGRQLDILAVSVWLRYMETQGAAVKFPADGYRGDYVRDIGSELFVQQGTRLNRHTADLPDATFARAVSPLEQYNDLLFMMAYPVL